MDTSVIPPGRYCYRVIKIQDGEVLSREIEKFGRELREFPYWRNYKEVLCVYWQRTDYGTVRCNFLDQEFIDEDEKAHEKIIACFGVPDALNKFRHSWALPDEIKICGIREDEDTEWQD